MRDKDVISLLAMFFIFIIFIYFGKSFLDDVDTYQTSTSYNNNRQFINNGDPILINYEKHKESDRSFNTYSKEEHIETNGFINELISKYNCKLSNDELNNHFIEAKKTIPIDYNLCYKGFKPISKEHKSDMPLPNMPMNYIKDENRSLKLSEEFKKIP
jgi:hypothetical protein